MEINFSSFSIFKCEKAVKHLIKFLHMRVKQNINIIENI